VPRQIVNTFIVFLLCGLWHGANWTYVVWGLYAAFFMSLEILLAKPVGALFAKMHIDVESKWMKAIRVVLMYLILVPAALIFRSSNLTEASQMLANLFTRWGFGADYFMAVANHLGLTLGSVFQILACIFAEVWIWHYGEIGRDEPEDLSLLDGKKARSLRAHRLVTAAYIVLAIGLSWIALLGSGASSAFQYFQF
jgi:D-alanyl-lipoteichoic acid acyltransferase DltB (MBOAT superfamily)